MEDYKNLNSLNNLENISKEVEKALRYVSDGMKKIMKYSPEEKIKELDQLSSILAKNYRKIIYLPEDKRNSKIADHKECIEARMCLIEGIVEHEKAIFKYENE
jgi:hypothetical protein